MTAHLLASDPGPRRRRPKLAACAYCGANGAACDSLTWLRGRTCCEACPGDHEDATEPTP